MMNLLSKFPPSFSGLAQSVESLNESLDRKLVTMTMHKTGLDRPAAERLVRERVDREVAKTMTKMEVGII
jgi:hypothetical protein